MANKAVKIDNENWKQYRQKWQNFVEKNKNGRFLQTVDFIDSEISLGKKNSSIVIMEEGKIAGVLPILKEKFAWFRRYSFYGPIGRVGGIEKILRSNLKGTHLVEYSNEKNDFSAEFILNIKGRTESSVWENSVDRKSRNVIRKAEKCGLSVSFEKTEKTKKEFYSIYSENITKYGIEPKPMSYFDLLFSSEYIVPVIVYLNKKAIASAVIAEYNKELLFMYSSSQAEALKYSPNNFLYWQTIKHAVKEKYQSVNFGPSRLYDNVAKFKKSMGGIPQLYENHIILDKLSYGLFIFLKNLALRLRKIN